MKESNKGKRKKIRMAYLLFCWLNGGNGQKIWFAFQQRRNRLWMSLSLLFGGYL
jgi:hypothetical protein